MVEISAILSLGKQSIAPDAPCGNDVDEDDDDFNVLREEIRGTYRLAEKNQEINWEKILEISIKILREKSKHLQVASYLSCALFEKQGYVGMEVALVIYHDLIKEYWQGLFPRRPNGRFSAIEWMVERLARTVNSRIQDKADFETVQRCQKLIEQIDLLLQEKFSGSAPGFGRLSSSLQRFVLSKEAEKKDQPANFLGKSTIQDKNSQDLQESTKDHQQSSSNKVVGLDSTQTVEPVPQRTAQSPQTTEVSAARVSTPIGTAEGANFENRRAAERTVRECQMALRQVAAFLLRDNLADPLPYHLARISAWMMTTALPDNEGGRLTKLQNIEPNRVQRFEDELRNSHYSELIPAVEATIFDARFWLDAHYYTTRALEGLGPTHDAAKRIVIEHLASFIRRLPGVLELCFNDGSPFASEQTKTWINIEVLKPDSKVDLVELPARGSSTINVQLPSNLTEAQPMWDEIVREATQLAVAGKINEGMALIQVHENRSISQRERFLWRLQQAQLCMQIKAFEVAMYQLEFLDEQIGRFGLETWEPSLCIEVLKLLLICYYSVSQKTKSAPSQFAVKIEQTYTRLCRLDAIIALQLRDKKFFSSLHL